MLGHQLKAVSCRVSLCRTQLHRQLSPRFASSATETSRNAASRPEPVSAVFRTKTVLQSPVEMFAIMRAIEKQFGQISVVAPAKDIDAPHQYTKRCVVVFRDPEALKRIPATGITLTIPKPPINDPTYGGPGIEDFAPFALPEEFDEDYGAASKGTNTIEVTLQTHNYYPFFHVDDMPRIFEKHSTQRSFLKWGGFAPVDPTDSSSTPSTGTSDMRTTLEYCRKFLGESARMSRSELATTTEEDDMVQFLSERSKTPAEPTISPLEPTEAQIPVIKSELVSTSTSVETSSDLVPEMEASPETPEPVPTLSQAELDARRLIEEQGKKALERQIKISRQLRAQREAERAMRPSKPAVPAPEKVEQPLYDIQTESSSSPAEEVPKPAGVVGRLMGLFGR